MMDNLSRERGDSYCGQCWFVCNHLRRALPVLHNLTHVLIWRTNSSDHTATCNCNNFTNMAPIDEALEELESLRPGERFSYTEIANKHGCNRTTLSKRHRGLQGTRAAQYESQRVLTDEQSQTLVEWVNELTKKGLPPSNEMLRNFAREIRGTGDKPGREWPVRWRNRHQDQIIYTYSTGRDRSRFSADSAYKYRLYFELMEKKLHEYDITPDLAWNMDEKGFLLGILQKAKRYFSKMTYLQGNLRERLQDGSREWITIIACICGDGTSLFPGLIYQALSGNLQDSWLQDFDSEQYNCFFASSPSGWTNNDLGYSWLVNVFDRETKKKARRRWRLLLLDGHGSHITMRFINYCDSNRILLALYPPHSTHTLQPLDVSLFGPLAKAYSDQIEEFLHDCQGISKITKRDFFRLFWTAWSKSITSDNIQSGWSKVGLFPWDPESVIQRFQTKDQNRPSSSESSTAVLQSKQLKTIQRHLQRTRGQLDNKKAQKVTKTAQHLAAENVLLKSQIQGLEKALDHEKKRRQRGKPLQFELRAPEDGMAIFYSPKKIQQARDKAAEKEEAIRKLREEKNEEKQRKMQEKAEKRRQIEERKMMS